MVRVCNREGCLQLRIDRDEKDTDGAWRETTPLADQTNGNENIDRTDLISMNEAFNLRGKIPIRHANSHCQENPQRQVAI